MRGKEKITLEGMTSIGITPAYAGKSVQYTHRQAMGWDHPRLCGEKLICLLGSGVLQGSPPPMRGKAVFRIVVFQAERITPAYAGKRLQETADFTHVAGSPPPMRGKEYFSLR